MFAQIRLLLVVSFAFCTTLAFSKKFQEDVLQAIVQHSVELPEKERLPFILQELNTRYGTTTTPNFHLFNGGYAHGIIGLIYASVTEYLIIYGTPLSNGGHSGRYLMNIYDFIYRGKVTITSPTELEGREVLPGQSTFLPWGQAHHYSLDKNTWMLEYGYGITATALPFMLLGLAATGDFIGTGFLVCDYTKLVMKNILNMSQK
jgi:hypothetical protein